MSKTAGNALISVFDKTGIADFAQNLATLGWTIYASGGTAEAIKKAGVDVVDTAELTGGGAILGHKVVTLSREIHAALLADYSKKETEELEKLGIPRIDLVCVDMYPLRNTIKEKDSTEEKVTEMTDIGGPAMLRSAAKGRRIVLSRLEQRSEIIEWLKKGKPSEKEFLRKLASKAEYEVANYVLDSASYLGDDEIAGAIGERIAAPTYGENPWQGRAGLYVPSNIEDPLGIGKFKLVEGVPLSYNNYTDVDRLLQTITHIAAAYERNFKTIPIIVLGAKHGNLCGAGVNSEPIDAIRKMIDGDPRAIFGGSVIVNFPIDEEAAEVIMTYKMDGGKRVLDVVMAPEVDERAIKILSRKNGKLRLFINPALGKLGEASIDRTRRVRHVRGGRLRQENYTFIYDYNHPEIQWSGKKVNQAQKEDMLIAWAIGSTSNSNTISIVKNGKLLSNGVGQQDRVTSAELALLRGKNMGHDLEGASAYSDSFFPFADGPTLLADAGVKSIITTRGSIRDGEVIDVLTKAGVSFVTLPDAIARGFFAH